MLIGMLDHLQMWILHFMKTNELLDKYNAIWLSAPPYHDLILKTKSYEEVPKWDRKKLEDMSWYLLGVVTQSLRGEIPAQCFIFNHAIECTQALLEFDMYARYKAHDNATLSYVEDPSRSYHPSKDVFLLGRAGSNPKARANALRIELVKKRKIEKETNAETWMLSKKQREMEAWWDYISHEIDVYNELDADFNFLMIHSMSHWVEQIRRSRFLQQYSSQRHEGTHKTNLKDGWNASNPNVNYLPQVMTFQRHILSFKISELELHALAQRQETRTATCKVLPSDPDLAAPLSPQ